MYAESWDILLAFQQNNWGAGFLTLFGWKEEKDFKSEPQYVIFFFFFPFLVHGPQASKA